MKNRASALVPGKRREQLRLAKRAQRHRERRAGLAHVQLALPKGLASRLLRASREGGFTEDLASFLNEVLIPVADFPALSDIAWNRSEALIPARDAFGLYERNWRLVDQARLEPRERALIERLAARFGSGLLNG